MSTSKTPPPDLTPPDLTPPDMEPSEGLRDTPGIIEDEPYEGLYRGAQRPLLGAEGGHQPDRFDLAEILREKREALGWSLDEVADITRVRRNYLEALEQAAYDVLPPRAFALGYVKAYAKALGLDEETLADMFRREVSDQTVRLQAPSGASLEDVKPNYRLYLIVAGCLVAGIFIWNVLQRQTAGHGARAQMAAMDASSWAPGMPLIHDGAIYVTRPGDAPKDQDIPTPYVTPGLEAGFASIAAENDSSEAAPVPVQDVLQMRKAFNPRGAVYGAEPENSNVTIQATKSVNLVLRATDGAIYFVHQLMAGEAYRIPDNSQQDVLVDVSDPTAFEIYYNGEFAGMLDAPVTQVAKLNARAVQLASALDARQAQEGQIIGRSAPAPAPVVQPVLPKKSDGPIPYLPAVRKAAPPAASATASSASAPAAAVQP
ncbi:helix-turn-helix domain-containing protein [Asticcacaulis sp. EMRT-3]|uniref:helix-turn-helix domain-containing protein n=1 Tax=Asticcacaulis sp. EMRT-3 TaxID=3040349 RepID=UPI0024AF8C3B|nr:helix-turn-helix domain-containing protein [Asticcacaulis sp. EMRT-3]MDI7776234.1 helix-turn-helix domain-containing protein [Asticcacaulis sp. EMRT-3]